MGEETGQVPLEPLSEFYELVLQEVCQGVAVSVSFANLCELSGKEFKAWASYHLDSTLGQM